MVLGVGGGADPGGMGALEVTEKRLLLTSGQSWVGISDDPLHSTFPPQALLNSFHYLFYLFFKPHTQNKTSGALQRWFSSWDSAPVLIGSKRGLRV